MDYEDIIDLFTNRRLNSKNNNFIITGDYPSDIISSIPDYCTITLPDNNQVDQAVNITIDMESVNVHNIFQYVLGRINQRVQLKFKGIIDLIRFDSFLRNNNIRCQLIIYNLDGITKEEQMLLNELFYFYSENYNITVFVRNNLKTYLLKNGKVLDSREDYQKVEFVNLGYQRELKKGINEK